MKDALKRAARTFVQGAVGIFALAAIGPLNALITGVVSGGGSDVTIDLNLWRNIGLACLAGGVIALVSLLQNAVEDKTGKTALK